MPNEVKKRIVKTPNGQEEVDLSEFADRVVKSLGKADIRDAARYLRWSYDRVYGFLSCANKTIPPEFLVLIARLTNRSLLWLLTGEGPEFIDNSQRPEVNLEDDSEMGYGLETLSERLGLINEDKLEAFIQGIVREELRRLGGKPSFELDLRKEEKKAG